MAFLSKKILLENADRLGVAEKLNGLTWPEQQHLVQDLLKKEGVTIDKNGNIVKQNDDKDIIIKELRDEIERLKKIPVEVVGDNKTEDRKVKPHFPFPKGRVLLAPEIEARNIQLVKYDEVLGDDLIVEEKHFDIGDAVLDEEYGTYRIKGKTGKKVIAQSTIPKENAQVTFDAEKDLVPVITYGGQSGYIFTHQHYPNVKELLQQSGYWHKYISLFDANEHPENIWYAAGKLLVCNISLVHYIFDEIEDEEAKKRGRG